MFVCVCVWRHVCLSQSDGTQSSTDSTDFISVAGLADPTLSIKEVVYFNINRLTVRTCAHWHVCEYVSEYEQIVLCERMSIRACPTSVCVCVCCVR